MRHKSLLVALIFVFGVASANATQFIVAVS